MSAEKADEIDGDISVCRSCWFWRALGSSGSTGSCRVRAPRVVVRSNEEFPEVMVTVTVFPMTAPMEWCGEFRYRLRVV